MNRCWDLQAEMVGWSSHGSPGFPPGFPPGLGVGWRLQAGPLVGCMGTPGGRLGWRLQAYGMVPDTEWVGAAGEVFASVAACSYDVAVPGGMVGQVGQLLSDTSAPG